MTDRKIQLIGMGAGGIESLPTSHKELILSADIIFGAKRHLEGCLLYTSPSQRDATLSRMPSSA